MTADRGESTSKWRRSRSYGVARRSTRRSRVSCSWRREAAIQRWSRSRQRVSGLRWRWNAICTLDLPLQFRQSRARSLCRRSRRRRWSLSMIRLPETSAGCSGWIKGGSDPIRCRSSSVIGSDFAVCPLCIFCWYFLDLVHSVIFFKTEGRSRNIKNSWV